MTKKALILSGGGATGAFQAGFLSTEKEKYDLIAGTSVGALNGAIVAQEHYGDLYKVWNSIVPDSPESIYKSKAFRTDGSLKLFGIIRELLVGPRMSLADSKPLFKLIQACISLDKIKCRFITGAISLQDRRYYKFAHSDFRSNESFCKAILASASIPVVFPPVSEFGDQFNSYYQMIDGGSAYGTPTKIAVDEIKESSHDWELTVIAGHAEKLGFESKAKNLLQVGVRAINSSMEYGFDKDLAVFEQRNNQPGYRSFKYRIIRPEKPLSNQLDFTKVSIEESWNTGSEMAKNRAYKWQQELQKKNALS